MILDDARVDFHIPVGYVDATDSVEMPELQCPVRSIGSENVAGQIVGQVGLDRV